MPHMEDPNLLVGFSTGDDAAVYRMGENLALIQTLDFFPPIVDDPYDFGAIAAANALSDVYAMGGKPLLALNIVGFPIGLPKEILGEILRGGAEKAREAGTVIAGGHTIDDDEPKYGLSVTGVVEVGKQVTNANARPGDNLVLTKPLGTGIITTAGKQGVAPQEVMARAVEIMSALNAGASESMVKVGVDACTDVTGYGLVGHLHNMLQASHVGARIYLDRIPTIDGVWELLEKGIAPGGTHRNRESLGHLVDWADDITDLSQIFLCDAQTSGGLLIAVPSDKTDALLEELRSRNTPSAAVIGEVIKDAGWQLHVGL